MWRIRYRNLYFLFFKPFFNSLSRSWSQPRKNAQLLLALLAGNFTLEKVGFTLRKNVVHLNFKVILQIFNVLEWKSQLFILFSKLVFDFWAGSDPQHRVLSSYISHPLVPSPASPGRWATGGPWTCTPRTLSAGGCRPRPGTENGCFIPNQPD